MRILILFSILVLGGCLPEEGKQKTNCGTNEAFNSVTRRCYSIAASRTAPTASLSEVTFNEDSGINNITLTYTDQNSDFAVACNILSYSSTIDGNGGLPVACNCTGGVCKAQVKPDLNFSGTAEFVYTVTDIDGDSNQRLVRVNVTSVNDVIIADSTYGSSGLLASTTTPVNIVEDNSKALVLGYYDVENDFATACQVNAISSNLTILLGCACDGNGVCGLTVQPTLNFFGNGEFVTYKVFANGTWSNATTLTINVTTDNDKPIKPADPAIIEVDEGGPATFDIVAGTDVDDLLTALTYDIIDQATLGTVTACAQGDNDLLNCDYSVLPANIEYNEDYRHATLTMGTNYGFGSDVFYTSPDEAVGAAFPSLRFRALTAGTAGNDIGIMFESGGTAGAEEVTVLNRIITIKIESGVTTSEQIKTAVDNNDDANDLVTVTVLGSVPETTAQCFYFNHANDQYEDCIVTATILLSDGNPGLDYPLDFFTYSVSDGMGAGDGTVKVSFSIVPVDDNIDFPPYTGGAPHYTGDEDSTLLFTLRPADNVYDLTDSISYRYVSGPDAETVGVVSDCLDLTGSTGSQDLTCKFVPVANYSGTFTVVYEAFDAVSSGTVTVTIQINGVDDVPVICQYSTYEQAPECGLAGCIGSGDPTGTLIPSSHQDGKAVYYYSTVEKKCFQSTDEDENTDWAVDTNGHLASYSINQNEIIEYSNIRLHEGSTGESTQYVSIHSISTSNDDLVPLENITLSHTDGSIDEHEDSGGAPTATLSTTANLISGYTPATWFIGKQGGQDDVSALTLKIIPKAGEEGTAIITLTVSDEPFATVMSDTTTTTVSFTVTVDSTSAAHNGWTNISSVGPKTDKNGDIIDDDYVCSYSRTKCNGGGPCRGTTTPGAEVEPDEFNALYLNEADPNVPSCYRAVAQVTIGDLKYTAKTDRMISIEYIAAGGATTEVYLYDEVGVIYNNGGATTSTLGVTDEYLHIAVGITSGVTTSDQIKSALEAITNIASLVEIENLTFGNPQVVTASPVALEIGASQIYKIQDLVWMSRSDDPITFEYVESTSGAAYFSVDERKITVRYLNTNQDIITTYAVATPTTYSNVKSLVHMIPINSGTANADLALSGMDDQDDATLWEPFNITCPISESDRLATCRTRRLGASCTGFGHPNTLNIGLTSGLEFLNESFYDLSTDFCYRNYGVADDNTWQGYFGTSAVTLSWEDFEVVDGTLTGYNVYRKVSGHGAITVGQTEAIKVNNTLVGADLKSFKDNWQSSRFPPIPRSVYFYEVRPVIDGVEARTDDEVSRIRVMSPPENMVFVHRWMVNRNICKMMHSEERDDQTDPSEWDMDGPADHYRCKYQGPGSTSGYYDIGHDLIVDRFEAGCPYSTSGCINLDDPNSDGTCIGNTDPNTLTNTTRFSGGVAVPVADTVYYDRSEGKCYIRTAIDGGADDWVAPTSSNWAIVNDKFEVNQYSSTSLNGVYRAAHLPPLTNVTQGYAAEFCDNYAFNNNFTYETIIGLDGANVSITIPNRKEQIAYSQWDSALSDSEQEILEAGLSLNSSPKCNTSNADGLQDDFNEDEIPDVNRFYTTPGTDSSDIRSFITGSDQTASCVSRYGVQDSVGNVAEFTIDRMRCDSNFVAVEYGFGLSRCEMVYDNGGVDDNWENGAAFVGMNLQDFTAVQDYTDYLDGKYYLVNDNWAETFWTGSESIFTKSNVYRLDGKIGPCNMSSGLGFCDDAITSWTIDQEEHDATKMSIPLGLPFVSDFNEDNNDDSLDSVYSTMEIGPSNGITSAQLHDDEWHFNTDHIFSEEDGCGAMTAGGGYESQTGAGVWNLEMIPCSSTVYGYINIYKLLAVKDMSYTSVIQELLSATFSSNAASAWTSTSDTDTALVFDTDETISTATNIFGARGAGAGSIRVALAANKSVNQTLLPDVTAPSLFTDLSDIKAARPSVGFRCLGRVMSTDYDEAQ